MITLLLATALALPECRDLAREHNHRARQTITLDTPLRLEGPKEQRPPVGTVRHAADGWLTIYQRVISPADGKSCTFYPNCSSFARYALYRRGPFTGALLAISRLGRPHGGPRYVRCTHKGRRFWFDPVPHPGEP